MDITEEERVEVTQQVSTSRHLQGRAVIPILVALFLFWTLLAPSLLYSGTVRYVYDELGRLIGVIDEQGQLTEYVYDEVGNILSVRRAGAMTAPNPDNRNIGILHRGETRDFRVTGSGFIGASLTAPTADIAISNLRVSASTLTFSLSATPSAALGAIQLPLRNAAGSATLALQVLPAIEITIAPVPLAVPPDSKAYQARVTQSEAAGSETTIRLVSANPAVATPGTATITLSTGQASAAFTIIGKTTGKTQFTLTGSSWVAPVIVDVYVDPNANTFNRQYAAPVGVVKGSLVSTNGPTPSGAVTSVVGVVKGSPISTNDPTLSGPVINRVGVVKGSPVGTGTVIPSGPVVTAVGVVKGSPVSPNQSIPSVVVAAPPVGITK